MQHTCSKNRYLVTPSFGTIISFSNTLKKIISVQIQSTVIKNPIL